MAELGFKPSEDGVRAQVPNCSQAVAGISLLGPGHNYKGQALSCFNRPGPLFFISSQVIWIPKFGNHCTVFLCLDFKCYSDATALPEGVFLSLQVTVFSLVPDGGETAEEPPRDPVEDCLTPCLALEIPQLLSLVPWPSPLLSQEYFFGKCLSPITSD